MAVLEVGSSQDARQEQLALRNCLELLGIPFVATTDVEEAVRRPFVVTGGILFNTELTPNEREVLYAYVERGGVLLATQVQGNMFFPLFGLVDAATSRTNFSVHFTDVDDPALPNCVATETVREPKAGLLEVTIVVRDAIGREMAKLATVLQREVPDE